MTPVPAIKRQFKLNRREEIPVSLTPAPGHSGNEIPEIRFSEFDGKSGACHLRL